VTALQKLIEDRLAELDISQRAACARTSGRLTPSTLSRIANGHSQRVLGRTIADLALALDVPQSVVLKAARATCLPLEFAAMRRGFLRLPPADRERLARFVQDLADEQRMEMSR
jgi:transcriptional regulator with XRE-family HTH domain